MAADGLEAGTGRLDRYRLQVEAVVTALDSELPKLPAAKQAIIPQPPPSTPLKELPKDVAESMGKKGPKGPPRWPQPVPWNEIVFVKPPAINKGQMESSLRTGSTRTGQLESIQASIQETQTRLDCLAAPVTGRVFRMALIEEPLAAPLCTDSEEVTTLMESALTSRRLRKYDVAVDMLMKARLAWASLLAGEKPTPWAKLDSPRAPSTPRDGKRSGRSEVARRMSASLEQSTQSITSKSLGEAPPRVERPDERRYKPERDFSAALGEGNKKLAWLPPEVRVYFLTEMASLHAAMREEPRGLLIAWRARSMLSLLPPNHPDAAIVWACLGHTLYHMEDFELAARLFARVRRIREKVAGENSVEAATALNNLACCFSAMDRGVESLAHLELARELLHNQLGYDHPRVETLRRNLEIGREARKGITCPLPCCFVIPVKDTEGAAGKKKKKKGKGKSAGAKKKP
mmetsp:Transcript_66057/g.123211  ORF Transcript_66057/g.123211 Transcript_66057/m.123211 type:complete len:461 (+) Transcript_66057:93-1475(+)